jgi:hypothetical protein
VFSVVTNPISKRKIDDKEPVIPRLLYRTRGFSYNNRCFFLEKENRGYGKRERRIV